MLKWNALVVSCFFFLYGCGNDSIDKEVKEGVKTFSEKCNDLINSKLNSSIVKSAELLNYKDSEEKYCKVLAEIKYEKSTLKLAIELPETEIWSKRLLQLGGGGFNGSIPSPSDSIRSYRFAIVSSDSGHQGEGASFDFSVDKTALENFMYKSHPIILDEALVAVKHMYNSQPMKKYFIGASTGGREALLQAQRYPKNYDGIIAGMPVVDYSSVIQKGIQVAQAIFNNGGAGWLNNEKLKLYENSQIEACDNLDGLKDNLIANSSACNWKPEVLRCPTGTDEGNHCFSEQQLNTVYLLRSTSELPIEIANGNKTIPAFGIGAEKTDWLYHQFGMNSLSQSTSLAQFSKSYFTYGIAKNSTEDYLTYQFDKHKENWQTLSEMGNATDPNLMPFFENGGKLILWHGSGDGLVPPGYSVDYYNKVKKVVDNELVHKSMKFYMIPKLGHGSPNVNMVDEIINWVEQNKEPVNMFEKITIDGVEVTRPLCEWPTWYKYNGSSDPNVYTSFNCVN